MRVNIAQVTPPSCHHNASTSSLPNLKLRRHRSQPSIFGSFHTLKSKAHTLRRSCSASFDGNNNFPQNTHKKKHHLNPLTAAKTTSFPHVEVLEPSFLGIRPDPPDWPARDELIRESIARRASSIELPLSLRMIKMKQRFQRLEEEIELGEDLGSLSNDNPIGNLCCSTLYIIKEVQSEALKIRGLVLDENLDGVVGKVQKEMTSSFVWLFREVFAKTPDLMLDVMVLTSEFATLSVETYTTPVQEKVTKRLELDEESDVSENEVELWNSMVEEANEMNGGCGVDRGLGFIVGDDYSHEHSHGDNEHDHDGLVEKVKFEIVSPVRVDIERDDYEEYDRTDLLYQIGLYQEPNNTLLLSNYAQFLCLVSRDYDRAEECFKRAIQLDSTDAEVVSQYANFLWLVRKDLWGAEERFQQAMAAEPDNSYHASKYASFLWSTGGEDTCYPLDPPRGKS